MIDVTMTDPLRQSPRRRVREIVDTVRAAECHGFARITLGGGRMHSSGRESGSPIGMPLSMTTEALLVYPLATGRKVL